MLNEVLHKFNKMSPSSMVANDLWQNAEELPRLLLTGIKRQKQPTPLKHKVCRAHQRERQEHCN